MIKLYEIKGTPGTEYEHHKFGTFTSETLANMARTMMSKDIRENTEVELSVLELNTIYINGEKIDLTKRKRHEEILDMAKNNVSGAVSGYLKFHISEIVGDLDEFREFLGNELAAVPVTDLDYSLESIDEMNNVTFKVTGNIEKEYLENERD